VHGVPLLCNKYETSVIHWLFSIKIVNRDRPFAAKFTKDHEWVRIEGNDLVTIGITDYAQVLEKTCRTSGNIRENVPLNYIYASWTVERAPV
jgi:hypothetical protein